MSDVIQIYHWEDDPEAEELLEELKKAGVPYQAEVLDAEIAGARTYVEYKGKTYWELGEFRKALEAGA